MSLKALIPAPMRLRYQVYKRFWRDLRMGLHKRLATPTGRSIPAWTSNISTDQIVRPSHLFENKIHNIKLAGKRIRKVVVWPGEVFSFWHVIGEPHANNGYKAGRNLVGGALTESIGGGLCQLSGILYHTALKAGLEIIERHNHSVDIYEDDQRFCPLGADATVVYGYKDLRFINNTDAPIGFEIRANKEGVTCKMNSTATLHERQIEFKRQREGSSETVTTLHLLNGQPQTVAISMYKKPASS